MFAKLTSAIVLFTAAMVGTVTAQPPTFANIRITYDDSLCTASRSTSTVSCSTGENGLITQGYGNLGQLPNFPNVIGLRGVGFNSTDCGRCFSVFYPGTGRAVTAIAATSDNDSIMCTNALFDLTGFNRNNFPADVRVDITRLTTC